jgi:hypothetical protein
VVLDAYVRVSQVRGRQGVRFLSPALQREQILGWAARHGVRIGEVFEELDRSGARRDRPLLERAVGRVEAGESGGLVVATTDRWCSRAAGDRAHPRRRGDVRRGVRGL